MTDITNHTEEKLTDLDKLIPNPRNPNMHGDEQVEALAKIIRFQGWRLPIVVSKQSGFIVRGHGRLQAAQKLGVGQAPVSFQDYENEAQEYADMIADNRIAELADMDRAQLKDLLEELDTGELDMDLTGFDEDALADLMSEFHVPQEGETGDDELPTDIPKRVSLGDLWILGDHRLFCGDSTSKEDVKKVTAFSNPQMMVTDPPYGVEYDPTWRRDAGVNKNEKKMGKVANDDRADWQEAWDLFPGNIVYVYHAGLFSGLVGDSIVRAGFDLRSQIIWVKDRMALSRSDYHWQHEPCWYAVRKNAKSNRNDDRTQTTTWEIPARDDEGHGHGTQKPVMCMMKPMQNHIFDCVYDPFLGSGTTLIAAEKMGKACIGIELNPEYCDIILQRWEDFTGKKAIKN